MIASTLKPIDDVRAYWKLSQSIAKTNKYEVNIIGNSGKKEDVNKNIKFHIHELRRNSWIKRFTIRWLIFIRIIRLKPDVLIITTHELIAISLFVKLFTSCSLIYDVQENYYLNLTQIDSNPFKKGYAFLIRFKEYISQFFIDSYWLAERCYRNELPFARNGIVVENKALDLPPNSNESSDLVLGFTGTISSYSGIQNALKIFDELVILRPNTILKITGQVHDEQLEKILNEKAEANENVILEISKNPVSYHKILETISTINFGIIGYEENEVNMSKKPTKLFEYSRYQLPYLVSQKTLWRHLGMKLGGAIPVDFGQIDGSQLLETLENSGDLFPKTYPQDMTWEFEETKILKSLNDLTK